MTKENQPKWIAGFWRRIGALIIDTLILGIIGQCLGFFLETFFVEIGVWARVVGFIIALVYFGVMNSKIGNGQTIGKILLKIKVVDLNGELISPLRSFFRYSVFALPFFLNGAPLPDGVMFSFMVYFLSLLVFGGFCSIIYLYLFNRVTRQSLHDIVVRTYVVKVAIEKQPVANIWKLHYLVVGLFCIAALVVPYFTSSLAKQESFSDLIKSRAQLMNNQVVQNATISYGKSTFSSINSGTSETTYVNAQVYLSRDETSNQELAKSLARSIVENYPDALSKDTITINLVYGFDIGIASRWKSFGHRFNPVEL